MADFLKETPDATIHVSPEEYTAKEKEYILFYEAKKKYYLLARKPYSNDFTTEDSIKVDKMSVKDSAFVHYMNKTVPDSMMFTVQEKCTAFLGGGKIVNTKLAAMEKQREVSFLKPFTANGVAAKVKIDKSTTGVPYNGFSYYKIVYNGEFPESLLKAYDEMFDLNEKKPRAKFLKERQKQSPFMKQ